LAIDFWYVCKVLTPIDWKEIDTVQFEGLDAVRNTTVPAYSFTKFRELPVEIRAKIWSLAARVDEPQIHAFVSMNNDKSLTIYPDIYNYILNGSSRILCESREWPARKWPLSSILHTCHQSRAVALNIYTCLAAKKTLEVRPSQEAYFNTLYGSFYMGYEPWNDFKILVDIIIKLNTTRPLRTDVQKDMERLRNIRNLIVDLNIFGAVPACVWAEFPKLEKLTIAFYGYGTISEKEPGGDERELVFKKPQSGKYRKRSDWVVTAATKTLKAAKRSVMAEWKLPTVEAVLRRVDADEYNVVDSDSEDEDLDQNISNEEAEEADEDDDSAWYQQAAAKMVHDVPKQEIKRLKHRHHPSLKASFYKGPEGKKMGDWLTDSETEGREELDDNREYLYTHEYW
jgi:2EXR family